MPLLVNPHPSALIERRYRGFAEISSWVFDRGATKPSRRQNKNPLDGESFVRGRRWLGLYSPLRGCSGLAALPTPKIHRRSTPRNFQTGSEPDPFFSTTDAHGGTRIKAGGKGQSSPSRTGSLWVSRFSGSNSPRINVHRWLRPFSTAWCRLRFLNRSAAFDHVAGRQAPIHTTSRLKLHLSPKSCSGGL